MTARIYIVEDNDIVRESLTEFITAVGDYDVCDAASTAEEALDALETLEVDLVLVDLSLPEMDGAEFIDRVQQRWPDLRCVICSGHRESTYVKRALEVGSYGYILKGEPYVLREAIPKILGGERYVSESLQLPQ